MHVGHMKNQLFSVFYKMVTPFLAIIVILGSAKLTVVEQGGFIYYEIALITVNINKLDCILTKTYWSAERRKFKDAKRWRKRHSVPLSGKCAF